MKSFRKYLFVVILLFCNLLCFAYEKLNLKGYIGSELSVPNKASDIIPDIKIRLSFLDSFKTGLRLSWNGKVIIYTGNITFSGTVSALKNPDFSFIADRFFCFFCNWYFCFFAVLFWFCFFFSDFCFLPFGDKTWFIFSDNSNRKKRIFYCIYNTFFVKKNINYICKYFWGL